MQPKTILAIPTDGLVNLYKPIGRSSAHYVYRLRRIFGVRKVGHAGTLDPFADGVLLGCVGRATKLVERLMSLRKRYRTTLRLGVTNETFDPERPFEPVPHAVAPDERAIREFLLTLIGTVAQVPPTFSAVRVGGVQSYERARKGRPLELAARPVRIDRLELVSYAWPRCVIEIDCGRGTYIRAIARDLGTALGCGAVCETLTRTAVGPFDSDTAVRLEAGDDAVRRSILTIDAVESAIASESQ
ncbi:MAG: tRNA pseudouridine(55) synthase TruB [Phycisphaerae bacterium]|nr:tRNA pseudouridine(55) synthase TruB [Phycisphaerae bacterium]